MAVSGRSLDLALAIDNIDSTPFTFTAALHTYLRVSDARVTPIHGLLGQSYRDSAAGGVRRQEDAEQVAILGEVNRIYFDVRSPLTVEEPERAVVIEMDGFTDVVVWNPGPAGSAALSDMEPDGLPRMLCVEAAAIGSPVSVAPGHRWRGRQRLLAR